METFWQKPIFRVIIFVILIVLIPSLIYIFRPQILSTFPSLSNKTQSIETTKPIIKPGNCLILEQKYCSQGKVISTKNSRGQEEIYIGFTLPPDVPIFAGRDGQVVKAKIGQPSALQGLLAITLDPNLGDPDAVAFYTIGDLQFNNMSTENVKEGDIIGYTQDSGIKNFGDYNLLVTTQRLDIESKISVTDKLIYELFPSINQ